MYERYATVTSGTGAKLSNQRALRKSDYICDFEATGSVSINPDYVNPETLHKAIVWGGENVGIGASRKMGWGRFEVREFVKME